MRAVAWLTSTIGEAIVCGVERTCSSVHGVVMGIERSEFRVGSGVASTSMDGDGYGS